MASYTELCLGESNDIEFTPPGEVAYVLDERRRAALAEVDNAKFSLFHVKVCFVAGVGFFTDAYDIFAITIASEMLGYVYGAKGCSSSNDNVLKNRKFNWQQDLGVKVATPVGTLVSQLLLGWLADILGRKRMYGIELVIMIVSTVAQALSGNAAAVDIISVLIFWRFVMGLGIGGDYPLSAVISSEFASTKIRGRMMTAVFAAQGWGNFVAALVAFCVTASYRNSLKVEVESARYEAVDHMWRLLIGLGSVPAAVALYFRLTIPETPRFTMDIERNIEQASHDISNVIHEQVYHNLESVVRIQAPKASVADFKAYFGQPKNFKVLFATAYSWFAIDVAYYGLGLNSTSILRSAVYKDPKSTDAEYIYKKFSLLSVGNIIISAAGLIPGYWVTFLFIDSWGRKPIQLMGFAIITVLLVAMGSLYNAFFKTENTHADKAFLFLYCLTNFFQNFGPNTTTFIVPGEIFPTRYRSTAHGISAASGKLGAILSQIVFSVLIMKGDEGKDECKDEGKDEGKDNHLTGLLIAYAFFTFTGVFSTLLLPETKGRSLEELSNEDQQGFALRERQVNGTYAPSAASAI